MYIILLWPRHSFISFLPYVRDIHPDGCHCWYSSVIHLPSFSMPWQRLLSCGSIYKCIRCLFICLKKIRGIPYIYILVPVKYLVTEKKRITNNRPEIKPCRMDLILLDFSFDWAAILLRFCMRFCLWICKYICIRKEEEEEEGGEKPLWRN